MSDVRNIILDKHARRILRPLAAKLSAKATDLSSGWIEGYAATWGNVDLQGHMMLRGCFARSIEQAIPAKKVKLMSKHYLYGGDCIECIGTVTAAREDDYGLWIHAELSAVQLAQDIRTKILEGHVDGLSVGFFPILWDFRKTSDPAAKGNDVVAHTECKLAEVTVTVIPVNEQALITAAKSQSEISTPSSPSAGKNAPDAAAIVAPVTPPMPRSSPRNRREIECAKAFASTLRL
jgi:HK97 family phage prohead protease